MTVQASSSIVWRSFIFFLFLPCFLMLFFHRFSEVSLLDFPWVLDYILATRFNCSLRQIRHAVCSIARPPEVHHASKYLGSFSLAKKYLEH